MRLTIACLLASAFLAAASRAQTAADVPVFKISTEKSTIRFAVKASVQIEGVFDKWDATFISTSADAASGVLDVKIQAASVNMGSGMKDGKLKSKDFFNVDQDPLITFHSTNANRPQRGRRAGNVYHSRSVQA